MEKILSTLFAFFSVVYLFQVSAYAEMYKWVDKEGNMHFTNTEPPSDITGAEEIKEIDNKPRITKRAPIPITQNLQEIRQNQLIKESHQALKKKQARCEIGISKNDYSPALGEASYKVNLFLTSADADRFPEVKLKFLLIIECYKKATYLFWSLDDFWLKYPEEYQQVLELCPYVEVHPDYGVFKDNALQCMWATASDEIKTLDAVFKETK